MAEVESQPKIKTAPVLGDFPAIASRLILAKRTFKWMLPFGVGLGLTQIPMFWLNPLLGAGMLAYFAGLFGGSYFYQIRRASKISDALPRMSAPRIEGGSGWCIIHYEYGAQVKHVGDALELHLQAISGEVVKDSPGRHYVATRMLGMAEANIYAMQGGGTGLDVFLFGPGAQGKGDDLLSRLASLR